MKKKTRFIVYLTFSLTVCALLSSCTTVRHAAGAPQPEVRLPYARNVYLGERAKREAALRQSMIETASGYIGIKYRYGCQDPKRGFDCSGLIYHVARENQIELPRNSARQAKEGTPIPWKKTAPGDLVFFGQKDRIHHVGIVQENTGESLIIIHSTTRKGVVSEDVLASPYWKKRIRHGMNFGTLL